MKKNIFRVLLAVGAIATVFAGCRKSELQQTQEPIKVTLRADRPGVQDETKTQLSGTDVLWSVGDKIGVTDNAGANATNNAFTNDATVASATTSFTGETAVSGQLYAYYPYSTENVNSTGAKPTIKTTQNPSSNASFDGSCDILVSKPFSVSPEGTQLSDLVFRRLTAVLKIVIKGEGLPSGEMIKSITLESSDTDLTGIVNVSFEKFDLDGFKGTTNSAKSVTVNAAPPFAVDGTTGLFACVYPGKFAAGTKLTISGVTDNCSFKKEIDLTSDLVFERGKITTLNVAIGTANVIPSASFIFNSDAGLTSLGIAKPNTGAGTNLGNNRYLVGPISMIATDGSINTRVWNSNGSTDLRVYSGGSLSISGATIKKIEFTGTSLDKLTSNPGTYSNGLWTGSAKSVKITASETVKINTIVVTYESGTAYNEYNVSCATVDGGTLSASPVWAEAGTQITLTATPNNEYVFNNDWSVKDASENPIEVSGGKFTMPASNVTVSGTFTKKTYAITANTADNGTYTVKVGGAEVSSASKGDKVTLEASPADGYLCDGWTVKETVSGDAVSVSNNAFNMPAAAVTITTSFSEIPDVEYDHAGTESDPYSVQDVLKFISTLGTVISENDVYAKGVISSINEVNTQYGNATYNIKDAETEFEVTVYRGKYTNGADFTSADQIAIGDEVVVKGKVKDHQGTKEFDTGNQIVSIIKAPYLKASASKTSIAAAGETVTITVDTNVPTGWDAISSDDTNFKIINKGADSFKVEVTANTNTESGRSATITVSAEGADDAVIELTQDKAGATTKKYYIKVTAAPSDWRGSYLIVYETGNVAFDGSLTDLDVASNTKPVTISNNQIEATDAMKAIQFTVAYKTGKTDVYSLKSASGKYIAGTKSTNKKSNGMVKADNDTDYEISFNIENSNAVIYSKSNDGNMTLRYNKTSGQTRFRFYGSGQEAISLYKLSE